MRFKKGLATLATVLMFAGVGLACGKPKAKENSQHKLMTATEITVKDDALTKGKDYKITVGDELVATVAGRNFRGGGIVGDKFTLETTEGTVIAYEKERKRWGRLNRAATVYDADDNKTGSFGEQKLGDIFSPRYKFHFYDADSREIGESAKFTNSVLGDHKIYDKEGNVDYEIDKQFRFGPWDKYVITVHDATNIPLADVILLTCVEDAIGDSN